MLDSSTNIRMNCVSQRCGFEDFSATSASALPLPRKNVVILLLAIPPTSAEAPDPADRFRFRFPAYHNIDWTNLIDIQSPTQTPLQFLAETKPGAESVDGIRTLHFVGDS